MPAAIGQFSQDAGGRSLKELAFGFVHNGGGGSSDACDVLQKESCRTAIVGNVEDAEEQAASRAIESRTASCHTEVLAREARSDEIHESTKPSAVEGEKVGPHRCRIQAAFLNARCHVCGCVGFPLNVAKDARREAHVGEPGSQSLAEHADAGAQFDGRYIQVMGHAQFGSRTSRG